MLSFLSEIIKIHIVSKLTFKISNKQNYKKPRGEKKKRKTNRKTELQKHKLTF